MSGSWKVTSTIMGVSDFADDIELKIETGMYYKADPQDFENKNDMPWIPEKTLERLKQGLKVLREAEIWLHEIDYLFEGDTGEESFERRLKEKLKIK